MRFRWLLLALPLAVACSAPALPPPVAAPPPAAPSPPEDADFPAPDRGWGVAEYEAARRAIEARGAKDPRSLPRRAAPAFARLVDRRNLAFAADPGRDFPSRIGPLLDLAPLASAVVRAYAVAASRGAQLDEEMLALTGFLLHLTRLQWTLADELTSKQELDAVRLGGLARMRRGSAEEVAGVLMMLRTMTADPTVAAFVADAREDLSAIVRRLPPGARDVPRRELAALRARAATPARRAAIDDLLAAIARLPPADFTVTSNAILGRDPAAPIVALPADRTNGADAKDKRSGPNDLYVVPLAEAASALPVAPLRRAAINFDPTTPYRLFVEVLFTLGQSDVGFYELRALDSASRTLFAAPPRVTGATPSPKRLHLTLLVSTPGVSLKTSAGHVGPGCAGQGTGITIPKAAGRHDLAALDACVRKLKGAASDESEVTLAANPGVPVSDIFDVADVVRGVEDDLFPFVRFGVMR